MSDIDTTICPMITVLPARVRYNDAASVVQSVQHDIARVGEFEHIPLSRIQKWVSESGGSLFDTLFSVSFKESEESSLWSVVESQNPEPDVSHYHIFRVRVRLTPYSTFLRWKWSWTPRMIRQSRMRLIPPRTSPPP